jgi:hypothetical protein
MKLKPLIVVIAMAMAAPAAAQFVWGIKGNDTGGIIPWSDPPPNYREVAMSYCAGWNKIGILTSVPRKYGDYAGFICTFPHGYDPVRDGTAFWAWLWNPRGGQTTVVAPGPTLRISK